MIACAEIVAGQRLELGEPAAFLLLPRWRERSRRGCAAARPAAPLRNDLAGDACLKRNDPSTSPAWIMSSRDSSCRPASTWSRVTRLSSSLENSLPMTEAAPSSDKSRGGSCSSRTWMSPCTVYGTRAWSSTPSTIGMSAGSARHSSSRKSGLPPERSCRALVSPRSSVPGSSSRISTAESPGSNGARCMRWARCSTGSRGSISRRAITISTDRLASASTTHESVCCERSSAHWKSSMTNASGRLRDSASKRSVNAAAIAKRASSVVGPTPIHGLSDRMCKSVDAWRSSASW